VGGGIACKSVYGPYGYYDALTLTNCTVAENTANKSGGGIYIMAASNVVTSRNSTIAGNTAVQGGGIYNRGSLALSNSIVAANTSQAADGDVVGAVSSHSVNNLIGDGTGITSGIRNSINGNQVGTHASPINPLLAPLGDNGGPTQTMALLPGGPAIDAGRNTAVGAKVTTDQRGQPRILNGTVDIGAFEAVPTEQAPAITSPNSATFVVGKVGSFLITTTGFPRAALSEIGTLPAGVTFTDNGNGTATLGGTPKASSTSVSPYTITIQAGNGVGTIVTQTFTLTINQKPAIISAASASFTVGQQGSFTFTTTGFPAATLSETGALPAGLTWTDNGDGTATLSGTPLAGSVRRTPYSFTIRASNGVGVAATQVLKLFIG